MSFLWVALTIVVSVALGVMIGGLTSCGTADNDIVSQEVTTSGSDVSTPVSRVQKVAFAQGDSSIDFIYAAENSVNAVVHIKTEITTRGASYNDFFGALLEHLYGYGGQVPSNTMVAYGSGVVITPDGYIVTNNHVVEGADAIEVTFNNKVKRKARLIGTDPTVDLALIKVEGEGYDYLTFGDSDKVRVGEWVLAVGNPFNLTSTVTAGIVSAKARDISILGDGSTLESFIQTDAAVNKGNSGGALVNTRGELIGINAAIASHTGVYEGYSFAIPSNIVHKVVDDLLLYGETQRAYLGVQISELTAELAEKEHIDDMSGVFVAGVVENGAADEAGIRKGDVITSINGNNVNTITQLMEVVRQYRPGDVVKVKVQRNGRQHNYDVTLKNAAGSTDVVRKGEAFFNEDLGLMLRQAGQDIKDNLRINNGLEIVEIRQGVFKRGGVYEGFVITSVNGISVDSKTDLERALASVKSRKVHMEGVYPNGMKMSFEFYN